MITNLIASSSDFPFVRVYSDSLVILESVLTCVKMYSFPDNLLTTEHFNLFVSILTGNLSSPSSNVRI